MQAKDFYCLCAACDEPMTLVRRLPQMSTTPEWLVFCCRRCGEVDSATLDSAPLPAETFQHAATLN